MGTGGGTTHQLIWFVLLPFSNQEGSFFGLHFLKIAIAGNSAGICFGGVCMQHNRQFKTVRAFYQFCIPYGTSAKPSFSPYGFHFYTTTVRSFWIQYRTVLLRNLHSARTGFIFTQLPYGLLNAILQRSIPYGTILLFHLQGEGVPRPLARSHTLLPWSRVLACAPTVSPFPTWPSQDVMATFECPKVLNPIRLLGTCTVRVSCHTVRASVRTFGSHLDINTVRCYTSNCTG